MVYLNDKFLDTKVVKTLSEHAKVYKIQNDMVLECDIVVYCNTYFDYDKISKIIKAKKSISWIHSKPYELEGSLLLDNTFKEKMNKFVCVSDTVKNEIVGIDESKKEVIHNLINEDIMELSKKFDPCYDSNKVNFIVVSRLSKGKGFERLLKFDEALHKSGIDYKITVIGNGRGTQDKILNMFRDRTNVDFIGPKCNPYPYMLGADYLVQLSDYETWCNVITEAKILGTPCIITDFPAAKEQIQNGENGLIIDLNQDDYSKHINDIISKKHYFREKMNVFKYDQEIEKWYNLLNS